VLAPRLAVHRLIRLHRAIRTVKGNQQSWPLPGHILSSFSDQIPFVPAERLQDGDLFALADGGTAAVVGIKFEEAKPSQHFTTYNLEIEDFHTYFVGQDGVWVHNAGGRECARLRSIYVRLRKAGKTPNEIFLTIERRLPGANAEFVGRAIDEALGKDVFPGKTNLWTKGEEATPGTNAWEHFKKHVRQRGEFPEIDDVVTYVQKGRVLVDSPPRVRSRAPALHETASLKELSIIQQRTTLQSFEWAAANQEP
jgi:hypothetical protein